MTVAQIVESLTAGLRAHETEAQAFESEISRERGLFEIACALKFHEGCCETLNEVLDALAACVEAPSAAQSEGAGTMVASC